MLFKIMHYVWYGEQVFRIIALLWLMVRAVNPVPYSFRLIESFEMCGFSAE
jgi:hypothetical protein